MQISSVLKHLTTATTLGLALTAIAASAFAQEASTGEATALTEVVVTGSRIPQPNTGAISPIQTVSQQEFKLQGTVDVETLLNNLPSVSPGDTQFSTATHRLASPRWTCAASGPTGPWFSSMGAACLQAMRRSRSRI